MPSQRLILGPRAVAEALKSKGRKVHTLFCDEEGAKNKEVARLAEAGGLRFEVREREELDAMAGDSRHQGVVAIAGEFEYCEVEDLIAETPAPAFFVALDQIQDPHNFGAIVRSAVAFGADGIITMKDRAAPVTPVVVRASAGATEHARIARVTNLVRGLDMLKDQGLRVVGLAGEGDESLESMTFPDGGLVLVVGAEGKGLRRLVREHCDALARIPMDGPIASLNASVAAGIALSHAASARRRHKGNKP